MAALIQGSATTIYEKSYVERAIKGVANNIPEAIQFFHIKDSSDISFTLKERLINAFGCAETAA